MVRMLPAAPGDDALPEAEISGCARALRWLAGGMVLGPFELHVPGQAQCAECNRRGCHCRRSLRCPPRRSPRRWPRIAEWTAAFSGRDVRGVAVVDDYGHHPTEIRATLAAARESGYGKVHVIFQPHRYTRTRDLMPEFAAAFDDADTVQILDIYAASEEPIAGVDAAALVKAVGRAGVEYAGSFDDAVSQAVAQVRGRRRDPDPGRGQRVAARRQGAGCSWRVVISREEVHLKSETCGNPADSPRRRWHPMFMINDTHST